MRQTDVTNIKQLTNSRKKMWIFESPRSRDQRKCVKLYFKTTEECWWLKKLLENELLTQSLKSFRTKVSRLQEIHFEIWSQFVRIWRVNGERLLPVIFCGIEWDLYKFWRIMKSNNLCIFFLHLWRMDENFTWNQTIYLMFQLSYFVWRLTRITWNSLI